MTVVPLRSGKSVHVQVGYLNPFLFCATCDQRVPYWHDPDRCGCTEGAYLYPCGHALDSYSKCPTWEPVNGCHCIDKETHDK